MRLNTHFEVLLNIVFFLPFSYKNKLNLTKLKLKSKYYYRKLSKYTIQQLDKVGREDSNECAY